MRAQQSPLPAKATSEATAIERSQRQSDNVYRWIKYFADQPKKSDASKPRTKTDSTAPVSAKKPELKVPTAAAEATGVTSTSATADVQQRQSDNALPAVVKLAVAVAAPATAETEVIADAATALVPIAVVEPAIPRELRNQVINATVRLSFTVQADGTVAAPSVISDSNRRLNKSAIEAIAQWRFEPIRNERVTEIEFHFIQE